MTCTTPLPERLDPPDTASECAICHRVTEDGRDLDLCDEAVDALLDAGAIRRNTAVDTGVQFVCESCLDDLHDAQERHRAEAFDALSDALGLDEYEHPALRERKMLAVLHPEFMNDDWSALYRRVANASGDETLGEAMTAWFKARMKITTKGEKP